MFFFLFFQLKEMILRKLQTPPETCCIRLIFASVSLGMGADLKHIQRVIHAGPPTTLESMNSFILQLYFNGSNK